MVGIADFTWIVGELQFEGIALGTAAALIIFHGMSAVARWRGAEPVDSAEDEGVKPSKLG